MKFPPLFFLLNQHMNTTLLTWFILTFLACFTTRISFSSDFLLPTSSLKTLTLDGHFNFTDIHHVAKDFGNQHHHLPAGVLHPKSVQDVASTINHIFQLGTHSDLTVAARGNGHSTQGQAQAHKGVVVKMDTLSRFDKMKVHNDKIPYIDVSGGELWINVLHESLKYGLTPNSWTDYLYLTVGGTLSHAGISGQAFKHGPQISNVYQLEIVTGKGEIKICSKQQNSDLFFAVLGGLGQFGIITRARIALAPAPKMVKWIRVLYTDFSEFTKDQEHLLSSKSTFDYIEGFVYINRTGVLNSWRSSFSPRDPVGASRFNSDGKTVFCLEIAKYYKYDENNKTNEEVETLLAQLHFIPSTLFSSEVSYVDFLNRGHTWEIKLRSEGLWDIAHPWLNLMIPRSRIKEFAQGVFENILTDSRSCPILFYPLNRSKWDSRTSAVIPDEDIFYVAAFLWSVFPGTTSLEHIISLNRKILDFSLRADIGGKQYLAHYTSKEEWEYHFGQGWGFFVKRKYYYDPMTILAPGQRIFQKPIHLSCECSGSDFGPQPLGWSSVLSNPDHATCPT